MVTAAARPHIVCWPRLSFAREATVAALREIDAIELSVADDVEALLPLVASADALVLHSAPEPMARRVVDAIVAGPGRLRWMHFLTAGRDGFEAAGLPRGVAVSHVAGASAPAVAEHALALLLALARRLPAAVDQARAARWDRTSLGPFMSLEDARVAVLGTGAIGGEVAKRLAAFGAVPVGISRTGGARAGFAENHPVADLHAVLAMVAAVVVAVPLDAPTRHLLDAAAFAAMPRGALVVNVGRGAVIDQAALGAALASGRLGGAGLDVTDPEPPGAGDPLWTWPNLIVTPHVAVEGNAATVRRLAEGTAENVRRFARGEPPLHPAER